MAVQSLELVTGNGFSKTCFSLFSLRRSDPKILLYEARMYLDHLASSLVADKMLWKGSHSLLWKYTGVESGYPNLQATGARWRTLTTNGVGSFASSIISLSRFVEMRLSEGHS